MAIAVPAKPLDSEMQTFIGRHTDKSFELLGFDMVGGYALQPRWADGHNTGIYSFTYLRRLAQHSN